MAELIVYKACNTCAEVKIFSEFYAAKRNKDGRMNQCKVCYNARVAIYQKTNAEKIAEQKRKYYVVNSERALKRDKEYRDANAEKISARKRAHRLANPEKFAERDKAYHEKYGGLLAIRYQEWREKNKDRLLQNARAYLRKRRATDPIFAMKQRISRSITKSLSTGGYTKHSRSHEVLGCDWDTFKMHIERQFTKDMSWEKMGEIHLDHIVPLATAKTEADVIALNHFTNIRPLWAADNRAKRDLITHLI